MTASSLVMISPTGIESDFLGSIRASRDIDLDDDFDILITDEVDDVLDAHAIPAQDIENFILFPAGHPGYNQF